MKRGALLAALSAISLSSVCHADIKVAVIDPDSLDPLIHGNPVVLSGVVSAGNHVHVSMSQIDTALGGLPSTYVIMWVYDEASRSGPPTLDIGSITITYDEGSTRVHLLVAPAPFETSTPPDAMYDGNFQADFNPDPRDPMDFPGAVNLGPIQVDGNFGEQLVAVSIAVTGDVGSATASPRDQVDVGTVYRLQAAGRPNPITLERDGGRINADITARGWDFNSIGGAAISMVTAYNAITGKVEAAGQVGSTVSASIDSIRLTGTPTESNVTGITGDVLAEKGTIGTIYTTGGLGTDAAHRSRIRAGTGIKEIRAVAEGVADVLDKDFFAEVESNFAAASPDINNITGGITLLETAGDFDGNIDTNFLQPAVFAFPVARSGVFVTGTFTGSIRVRHSVLLASIGVGTFTPPEENPDSGNVIIDHGLDGAVVITNDDGQLPFISIGMSPSTVATNYRPGFVGTGSEPQTTPFVPWESPVPAGRLPQAPPGQSQPDSIIAAPLIGKVVISHMYMARLGAFNKPFAPRIESPLIGELIVDDLREGVIWSGNLEYTGASNTPVIEMETGRPLLLDPQDQTDDYSTIGSLQLGCVGPGAHVWFQGTSLAKVSSNLLGEFHLPLLAATDTIEVRGRLGIGFAEFPDKCECLIPTNNENDCLVQPTGGWTENAFPPATDGSPRHILLAPVGAIRIAQNHGLQGQIVINQVGTEIDAWAGQVVVGESTVTPSLLAPESSQPWMAPYYTRPSEPLGSGAVGLAPFHLYSSDCVPPNGEIGSGQGIPAGMFFQSGAVPVVVRHYGPIKLDSAAGTWDDAVLIEAFDPETCSFNASVDELFDVVGPGDAGWTDARAFGLRKPANAQPKGGLFRISLTPGAVVCAEVVGNPEVVWTPLACDDIPSYTFRVLPDCDLDGIPDSTDTDFHLCPVNPCAANYDGDANLDVGDLFAFLTAFFSSNSCADFNQQNGVTVQDIFDFLEAWFGGNSGTVCDPAYAPQC